MRTADEIRDEIDPIKREIYAAGYDMISEDVPSSQIILSGYGFEKRLDSRAISQLDLTFRSGLLPDGRRHDWVSESDGSAAKLRELIRLDSGRLPIEEEIDKANGVETACNSMDFDALCRPLIKFLNDNYHPHVKVIVTPTGAELLEGMRTTGEITDYLKD